MGATDRDVSEHSFTDPPRLDGELCLLPATREQVALDLGNLVHRRPRAVLRARTEADIARMIAFCRERGIPVSARGQSHSMFGQGLTDGVLMETRTLSTIHSIDPSGAVVDAGARWSDVLAASLPLGLRPRGLTGYAGLSIGGTLSVGGCPLSNRAGGLVDHVTELRVATGTGELLDCSPRQNVELFEAALGGLGQCGVITRAKVDLVPALPMARTYLVHLPDARRHFHVFRQLLERNELDEMYSACAAPGVAGFFYEINATTFFDPAKPPDDAALLRGLDLPKEAVVVEDRPYVDYATLVDTRMDLLRRAIGWDTLLKPWFDVWLPDAHADDYIAKKMETLTSADVGAGGFVLILPQRRSAMKRPFFRVPDNGDWVFLFDVTTTSNGPGPDPAFVENVLTRNRAWFDEARALGGVRYPIGALRFTAEDWASHYGDAWPAFQKAKAMFDPDRILARGAGVF
jgi:cytokinin dehydrogenase